MRQAYGEENYEALQKTSLYYSFYLQNFIFSLVVGKASSGYIVSVAKILSAGMFKRKMKVIQEKGR